MWCAWLNCHEPESHWRNPPRRVWISLLCHGMARPASHTGWPFFSSHGNSDPRSQAACCHLHLCQNLCSVKIASSVLLSSSHVPNGTSWHICLQAGKAIDQEVAAAQRSFVGSLCKGVYILLISLDVSTFHVPILKIELMARSAWSFSVEGRQLPPCVEAESGASPYLFGR